MSVFTKMNSRTALTAITSLKAYMKATSCIDFVHVLPDQNFNCGEYVKCVFVAKNHCKDTKSILNL